MKLLHIFDPRLDPDQDADARYVNTLEEARDHLRGLDHPAAFHVHEYRVSNDPQTVVCMLNGEFCFPPPIRAWKGTNRGGLKLIAPPALDPADRIQAGEAARGA